MPVEASIVVTGVLVLALGVALFLLLREREWRKQRGLFSDWPVGKVLPEEFDPMFRPGPHGPDRATEIRSVGAYRVVGGIGDYETWILCNLARSASAIFEFGTCTGKTSYLLAANAPGATVTTLTLPPDALSSFDAATGDDASATRAAKEVSGFSDFYYQGTAEADRIVQLFGDSKAFDDAPYRAGMDLVFVDGAHTRSYVENDSAKALRMVRPGGVVLWHDYRGPRRAKGVFAALNDLARTHDLVHIADTSLVAWRAPPDPDGR